MLALLLSLKNKRDWDDFEREIREATQKFTSLEIKQIEALSEENFSQKIIVDNSLSHEQQKILANLLFEKMSFYAEKGLEEEYEKLREKCIVLYDHIKTNYTQNEYDLDVHYKLELLKKI